MQKKKGTYIQRTPPPVPLAITPTFRPWTHTSYDSYLYQLSLVVATATVSSAVVVLFVSILRKSSKAAVFGRVRTEPYRC